MPSTDRARRLSARIREELADILLKESSDPRLRMLSLTDVRVDREFAVADVFVSAVDCDEERREGILQALHGARGFLRSTLASRIPLRTFPQLRFHWDFTPERAEHIESLIDSLQQDQDPKP